MPISKHASSRHEVLDRCMQKQSDDNTQLKLRELCSDAVANSDPDSISEREKLINNIVHNK